MTRVLEAGQFWNREFWNLSFGIWPLSFGIWPFAVLESEFWNLAVCILEFSFSRGQRRSDLKAMAESDVVLVVVDHQL